MYTTHFNTLH